MHDFVEITRAILDGYALPWRGTHGVLHWARVWTNGLKVAEVNGADQEIVKLFALFHDSRRVNERTDPGHGERSGDFARELRGTLVHLDDDRFELLYEACRLHTDGLTDGDPTEQACWDADRLDLGRVGMKPSPRRLCTDAGRALIDWSHPRAERGVQDESQMGEFTVKLYTSQKRIDEDAEWQHERIVLKPDSTNPDYEAIILEKNETQSLRVIGEYLATLS